MASFPGDIQQEKFGNHCPNACVTVWTQCKRHEENDLEAQDMETVVAVCQREPGETVNEEYALAFESVDILPLLLLCLSVLPSRLLVGICNLKSPGEIPRIFAFLFLPLPSCSPVKYCMFWFKKYRLWNFLISGLNLVRCCLFEKWLHWQTIYHKKYTFKEKRVSYYLKKLFRKQVFQPQSALLDLT